MNRNLLLTVTSLLTLLFLTFHLAADVAYGFEPGGVNNVIGVLIIVVYLCGILLLPRGLSGYIVLLILSLLASGVPIIHMTGAGLLGARTAESGVTFLWVWSNLFLDVMAFFSVVLSALGLWSLWRSKSRQSDNAGV